MAEAVVDGLELVEVDEHDGNRCSGPLGAGERMLDAIREQRPVGEVRDGVVEGLMGELLLEHLALADVAAVQDDSADVLVREQVGVLDLELEPRSVAMLQRAVDHVSLDALAADARDHLREAGTVGVEQQLVELRAFDLARPLYPSTRSIDGLWYVTIPSLVEHRDEVARMRHERAEPRLALPTVQILCQRGGLEGERDLRREPLERVERARVRRRPASRSRGGREPRPASRAGARA